MKSPREAVEIKMGRRLRAEPWVDLTGIIISWGGGEAHHET